MDSRAAVRLPNWARVRQAIREIAAAPKVFPPAPDGLVVFDGTTADACLCEEALAELKGVFGQRRVTFEEAFGAALDRGLVGWMAAAFIRVGMPRRTAATDDEALLMEHALLAARLQCYFEEEGP